MHGRRTVVLMCSAMDSTEPLILITIGPLPISLISSLEQLPVEAISCWVSSNLFFIIILTIIPFYPSFHYSIDSKRCWTRSRWNHPCHHARETPSSTILFSSYYFSICLLMFQIGDWLSVNGEAIYKTRIWRQQQDVVFPNTTTYINAPNSTTVYGVSSIININC